MRDQRGGLSHHDEMRDILLPAWGRQGWENRDKPDPERGSSSIYERGKKDERDLDPDAAPVDPVFRLSDEHWEAINFAIEQLDDLHRRIICEKFYKGRKTLLSDVDGAVRALLDLRHANRRVVDVMKRWGW